MKLLRTIMSVLTVFVALSCTKNQSDDFGQVVFVVSSDEIVADQTKSNVSDYTQLPSKADFSIVFKPSLKVTFVIAESLKISSIITVTEEGITISVAVPV